MATYLHSAVISAFRRSWLAGWKLISMVLLAAGSSEAVPAGKIHLRNNGEGDFIALWRCVKKPSGLT